MTPLRFPFVRAESGRTAGSELAYLPLRLSTPSHAVAVMGVLDTGSTVNALLLATGLELGLAREEPTMPVKLTGNLANYTLETWRHLIHDSLRSEGHDSPLFIASATPPSSPALLLDRGAHGVEEQRPDLVDAAAEHHQLRVQDEDHVGDADAQVLGRAHEHGVHRFVSLGRGLGHLARGDATGVACHQFVQLRRLAGQQQPYTLRRNRRPAGIGLQAAPAPTAAVRAVGRHRHVAEFG